MTSDLQLLNDQKWRLNNLYRIINKDGFSIPFRLNVAQETVLDGLHNRNVILKGRQIGMSTFAVLYVLDESLFNENLSSGIVSYSRDHAEHIFRKIIGHALDSLSQVIKQLIPISQRSMSEISFKNGSSIRVGTTLRGGTCQNLLVSEFGKTCARDPLKAEEVITGTIQTVPKNGRIIIESTGEGNEGFFVDLVTSAKEIPDSELCYKRFFFPWFTEITYAMREYASQALEDITYFKDLKENYDVNLSLEQQNWYLHQKVILKERVKQEYPSLLSEAFISSDDAYYFQRYIEKAHNDKRCLETSLYDPIDPVYVSFDIGVNDFTVITFFQIKHGEIRLIDYYADKNKPCDFYINHLLNEKEYLYSTIFLPHDSKKRDSVTIDNPYEQEVKRLVAHTGTRVIILPRTDKQLNIVNSQNKFSRCIFAMKKMRDYVNMIAKYRKEYSQSSARYIDKPYHDNKGFSDHADSFIYAMQAVTHIETRLSSKGLSTDEISRLNARNRRLR